MFNFIIFALLYLASSNDRPVIGIFMIPSEVLLYPPTEYSEIPNGYVN